MISRLILSLIFLFSYKSVFCQKTSDRRAIKTLLETDNNSKFRGYLTGISEDSISLFVPKFSMDTAFSLISVNRIGFIKKSSFGHGFATGFGISETALIFLTAGETDSFMQIFLFVVGNILIVAPTSLASGLVGATPDIQLDLSGQENFSELQNTKLSNYAINSERIRITSLGLRHLDKLKFPDKPNRSSLQLDYAPKYYFQPFEPGFWWSNIGSQIIQKYTGAHDESYDERRWNIEATVGFAWSPSKNWEFGCQFSSNSFGEVGFTNNEPTNYSSTNFSYSYNTQNIYALRRFSPYQNGYGDRWQFNIGNVISHINSLTTVYINAGNESTVFYDERTKEHSHFGLGIVGALDYFITKHFSLCLRLQNTWFSSMKIDGFSQETYNVQWDEFDVNPVITTLSFGLRGQF